MITVSVRAGKPVQVVRCDCRGCLPNDGAREQSLKVDVEHRQSFIDAIGWLTRRVMVAGTEYHETHLCPFCAAREGHAENLDRLVAVLNEGKKAKLDG
jgi:hypothetical protein